MKLKNVPRHITFRCSFCIAKIMMTVKVRLMDIMMPEMNGYETTKAIRNMPDRPDGKRIPIIAMTANAFAEDIQAALDAGMDGHVAKPVDMGMLLSVITKYVKR